MSSGLAWNHLKMSCSLLPCQRHQDSLIHESETLEPLQPEDPARLLNTNIIKKQGHLSWKKNTNINNVLYGHVNLENHRFSWHQNVQCRMKRKKCMKSQECTMKLVVVRNGYYNPNLTVKKILHKTYKTMSYY